MTATQQIVLAQPIAAAPVEADFKLTQAAMPTIVKGELLAEVLALSLDPYLGPRMRGRHMSGPAPQVGELIPGGGVARVIESRADGFAPGDIVTGETGWRTHAAMDASASFKMGNADLPASALTGAAGMPGLTAWASATQLAKVRSGDRVLVSSAAGPVGGTVGQIARINGASKVVGIAGGAEKCAAVVEHYGFDACVDYKSEGWQDELAALFPDGVTYYHDNVGDELLDVALANLADYGRVVLCGLASGYQRKDGETPTGPYPGIYILKRANIMGLVVYDFFGQMNEFSAQAAQWIKNGELRYLEDSVEGLQNTPALFTKLIRGENIGKTVVKLANK